jgi:hypothetical protein
LTDARIVTSTYRYKRPPRKRQAAPLAGAAVIATKSSRRPIREETAAEFHVPPRPRKANEAALSVARPAANDDRKLATVTAKPAIVTTTDRKQTKLAGAARRREDRPEDPEAATVMRAWLEEAKWGRGWV